MPVFKEGSLKTKNKISYLLNNKGIGLPNALDLSKESIRNVCKGLKRVLKKYKIENKK